MTAGQIAYETASASPVAGAAGRAPLPMAVRQLRLTEFRNYRYLRLDLAARSVVLTGDNGAGKTNLLEAVSFLVPGRGLRRARLDEIARRGSADERVSGIGWAVAATLDGRDGRVAIGTGVETASDAGSSARRSVRIDGQPAVSQNALAEQVSAVWLTPELDRLFVEGPGDRRRFLDRMVGAFAPGHAGELAAYDHGMRQRARLLAEDRRDAAWLAALEESMARHGVAIAAARADLVARLDAAARLGVGPFPGVSLALAGEVDGWIAASPAADAEDMLRARLAALRQQDAESGMTLCGPHRSDLVVHHCQRGIPAARGSTGEQKAMLVAIVLAHARLVGTAYGRAPLLLLDEIAAHLDAGRREALFEEIAALGAQAWMTGTEAAIFAPLGDRAQFLRVEAGTVLQA
jgi:DNA replication and repair protein RecF